MKTIRELFFNLTKSSHKWDPYFDVYERHLNKFINKSPRVLEIGIQRGGSIELWQKYFGDGCEIIGIDIDPNCLSLSYDKNIKIHIGDQSDTKFLEKLIFLYGNFDIIVDDGGHSMIQQITTLQTLYPYLNIGGVYIIEDVHTSYHEWPKWNNMTFMEYTKNLIDVMNSSHIVQPLKNNFELIDEHIYKTTLNCLAFYDSIVVLEKENVKPFKDVFSK